MKTAKSLPQAQEELMEILEMRYPPVAVRLLRHEGWVPHGVAELETPMFYCAMVKYAMVGNVFYARAAKHGCERGASALGLCETPREEETGEFYLKKASCGNLRFVEASPKLRPESVYATLLAPPAEARRPSPASCSSSSCREEPSSFYMPPFTTSAGVSRAGFRCRDRCRGRFAPRHRPPGCEYLDEAVIVGLPAEMLGAVLENLPRLRAAG